jgi:hypothetical protein
MLVHEGDNAENYVKLQNNIIEKYPFWSYYEGGIGRRYFSAHLHVTRIERCTLQST